MYKLRFKITIKQETLKLVNEESCRNVLYFIKAVKKENKITKKRLQYLQ